MVVEGHNDENTFSLKSPEVRRENRLRIPLLGSDPAATASLGSGDDMPDRISEPNTTQ